MEDLDVMRRLEWSGTRKGPGSGPMDSGPGKIYPACPMCGGVKPGIVSDFYPSAHGHRTDCELGALLDGEDAALALIEVKEQIGRAEQRIAQIEQERASLKMRDSLLWEERDSLHSMIRDLKTPRTYED